MRSGDDSAFTEEALADLRDFEESSPVTGHNLPRLLDPLRRPASPQSVVDTPFEVESGQIHIGRYTILRILGEGGGGVVALAKRYGAGPPRGAEGAGHEGAGLSLRA